MGLTARQAGAAVHISLAPQVGNRIVSAWFSVTSEMERRWSRRPVDGVERQRGPRPKARNHPDPHFRNLLLVTTPATYWR